MFRFPRNIRSTNTPSTEGEISIKEETNSLERNLLTLSQQQEYLEMLLRGASPAAACVQLGIDLFELVDELSEDDDFRMKLDAVYDALSQNVAARLYQEAMKGNVSAMTQWLKNRPPPEWPDHVGISDSHSSLEVISDEELIRLARLENVAIPPELEESSSGSGSSEEPETLP